jgi:hypothetical protein
MLKQDRWTPLPVTEVWVDGADVIILGEPDSDDESHNCDEMGCGQCHVIARGRLTLGAKLRADELAVGPDGGGAPLPNTSASEGGACGICGHVLFLETGSNTERCSHCGMPRLIHPDKVR